MNNKRKVIRLECGDFLDMRLSDKGEKIRGEVRDFSLMGICFSSNKNWVKGQDIYIDYFMRDELDAVRMRVEIIWSEFIDPDRGYFCGGKVIAIEEDKREVFRQYYYRKLEERT